MLLDLPRTDGHESKPRIKNVPAWAEHSAEAVRDAIFPTVATLPQGVTPPAYPEPGRGDGGAHPSQE